MQKEYRKKQMESLLELQRAQHATAVESKIKGKLNDIIAGDELIK